MFSHLNLSAIFIHYLKSGTNIQFPCKNTTWNLSSIHFFLIFVNFRMIPKRKLVTFPNTKILFTFLLVFNRITYNYSKQNRKGNSYDCSPFWADDDICDDDFNAWMLQVENLFLLLVTNKRTFFSLLLQVIADKYFSIGLSTIMSYLCGALEKV